jgi:hypothetical protein
MENKKAQAQIWIIISLILIGGVIIFNFGDVASIFQDREAVYVAREGSLGCIKDDSFEFEKSVLENRQTYSCGSKNLVDECEVQVGYDKELGFFETRPYGEYRRCNVDGSNCGRYFKYSVGFDTDRLKLPSLSSGERYEFKTGFFVGGEDYTIIELKYFPYRLWTEEGGAHFLTRSADCCLANQREIDEGNIEQGEWECLEKTGSNKFKNYVIDFIKTQAKVYNYGGEDVVCLNNALYELEIKNMADGSSYKTQGEKIKNVQCCPHQTSKCNNDFEFIEETETGERSCSLSLECENLGNPWTTGRTTAKKEVCINRVCVEESFNIECDSDARCRSLKGEENWVCDLSYKNFGTCIKQTIEQERCGDLICQTGETKDNCPSDCDIICLEGEKLITTEKEVGCLIGWPFFIIGCEDIVTKECSVEGFDWMFWMFWILISLFVGFIIFMFRAEILTFFGLVGSKIGLG